MTEPLDDDEMAALLEEHGRDVTYWENTEGGHGGASTAAQWATWHALAWAGAIVPVPGGEIAVFVTRERITVHIPAAHALLRDGVAHHGPATLTFDGAAS